MILSNNESRFVKLGAESYLYFGGTNYLGIAHRKELLSAAESCFNDFGFSSGASRLTSGENDMLVALENELAEFCAAESALTLPAGFMANQAVVEAIDAEIDVWITSNRAHSSIQSAIKHSRREIVLAEVAQLYDREVSLRERFSIGADRSIGIFSEPIDALTGRVNQVEVLSAQISQKDYLVLDEAQSIGVLGDTGRGALEHFSISTASDRILRTGTFSKAFGTYGGFIVGAKRLIELVKTGADGYRGSTSLPPLLCAASRESLRLIKSDLASTVLKLKENVLLLNRLLSNSNPLADIADLKSLLQDQHTPIYYLVGFDDVAAKRRALFEKQIYIPSMSNYFPGTTEQGLRFTIQSGHTESDLHQLVDNLEL